LLTLCAFLYFNWMILSAPIDQRMTSKKVFFHKNLPTFPEKKDANSANPIWQQFGGKSTVDYGWPLISMRIDEFVHFNFVYFNHLSIRFSFLFPHLTMTFSGTANPIESDNLGYQLLPTFHSVRAFMAALAQKKVRTKVPNKKCSSWKEE